MASVHTNPKYINLLNLPNLPFSKKSDLPSLLGVYFILSETDEVLYIGKVININDRWHSTNHHKYQYFSELQGVKITWLCIEEIESLLRIEKFFISTFNPIFNGYKTSVKILAYIKQKTRYTSLSKLCKQLRKTYDLNPQQMANKLGVVISNYERYETAKQEPTARGTIRLYSMWLANQISNYTIL